MFYSFRYDVKNYTIIQILTLKEHFDSINLLEFPTFQNIEK